MYSVRVLWIPVVLVVALLHSCDFLNFSHVLNYIVFTDEEHKIQRKIIACKRRAPGEHRPLPRWIRSGCGVHIRSHDLEDFQNLTATSLSKVTSVIKFSWRCDPFFQRYEPNCGEIAYLTMLKSPVKFLDPDPDADCR